MVARAGDWGGSALALVDDVGDSVLIVVELSGGVCVVVFGDAGFPSEVDGLRLLVNEEDSGLESLSCTLDLIVGGVTWILGGCGTKGVVLERGFLCALATVRIRAGFSGVSRGVS